MLDFDDTSDSSSSFSSNFSNHNRSRVNKRKSVESPEEQSNLPVITSLDTINIGKRSLNADDIKLIGGRGYDLRQPVPIKYKIVRERFLNARNNFWLPNEIQMGEDKLEWQTAQLTSAEMYLFKLNISYLTASDSLVPDNLNNAILNHITAPEMRQYLRWQIAEEANHLESYLFILESFGLDEQGQGQIFNLYQEVPALINKLNWNIKFTNNVASSPFPPGHFESQRALLEDLISYYVFEYLFFPLGFSQIFALARTGKLRNTAQQYSYIWRDENLHSANGLWMIKQIIIENPHLWDNEMKERTRAIVNEAVHLETEYAHASMPDGGIIGLPVQTYIKYAQFIANTVCKQLNVKSLFPIKDHPMPWLSEYELRHEVNFFEGRVREYQTGSQLSWD